MKEYGSSIQKLVDNMVNIEDREKRTRYAHILIELMRQIHPNMKDGQDYYNKLWDDLYIMSGFTLDVDSPYPPPSEEALGKKPQRVPYNTHHLKFKHFGRNVDLLVAKAISLEEPDERRAFVSYLTRLMRTFYQAWNKESVEDETIYQSLIELSNGKLYDDIKLIREQGLVEATPRNVLAINLNGLVIITGKAISATETTAMADRIRGGRTTETTAMGVDPERHAISITGTMGRAHQIAPITGMIAMGVDPERHVISITGIVVTDQTVHEAIIATGTTDQIATMTADGGRFINYE